MTQNIFRLCLTLALSCCLLAPAANADGGNAPGLDHMAAALTGQGRRHVVQARRVPPVRVRGGREQAAGKGQGQAQTEDILRHGCSPLVVSTVNKGERRLVSTPTSKESSVLPSTLPQWPATPGIWSAVSPCAVGRA